MASREKRALAPSKTRQKANDETSISNLSPTTSSTNSVNVATTVATTTTTTAAAATTSTTTTTTTTTTTPTTSSNRTKGQNNDNDDSKKGAKVKAILKRGAKSLPLLSELPPSISYKLLKYGVSRYRNWTIERILKTFSSGEDESEGENDNKKIGVITNTRNTRKRKQQQQQKQKKQQQVVAKAGLKRLAGTRTKRKNNAIAIVQKIKNKPETPNKKNKTLVQAEVHRSEDQTSPKLNRRVLSVSPKGKKAASTRATPLRKLKNNLDAIRKESEIIQIKQEIDSNDETIDSDVEKVQEQEVNQELAAEEEEEEEEEEEDGSSVEDTIENVIASSMLIVGPVQEEEIAAVVELGKVDDNKNKGKRTARGNVGVVKQQSLRNGKLRQQTKIETDNTVQERTNMSKALTNSVNEANNSSAPNLVMDGVFVKVETPTNDDDLPTNNHHHNVVAIDNNEHQTNNNNNNNNNVCDDNNTAATNAAESSGPRNLRSKTKARNSDSSSETSDDVKPPLIVNTGNNNRSSTNEQINVDTLPSRKEQRNSVKTCNEAKNLTLSQNNNQIALKNATTTSRRGSLNNDSRRSSPLYKDIDDMVSQIKFNISKAIESKVIFRQPDNKTPVMLAKNFDVKLEDVVAPLSNDAAVVAVKVRHEDDETGADNLQAANNIDLAVGPNSTKKEPSSVAEETNGNNSVPKLADTAKEIEKLVMGGDNVPTISKPSSVIVADNEINDDANDNKIVKTDEAVIATNSSITTDLAKIVALDKIEKTSVNDDTFNDDGTEKDKQQQPVDLGITKKTTSCVKRKSPRSTVKGSAKSKETQEKAEVVEVVDSMTTSGGKNLEAVTKEECDEIKIVNVVDNPTESEVKSIEPEPIIVIDDNKTETSNQSAKMDVDVVVDPTTAAKTEDSGEETLESLSRDVERLVAEDDKVNDEKINNAKRLIESEENDASADEMRLVIDDHVTNEDTYVRIEPTQQQNVNDDKQDCDVKSRNESSSDVKKIEDNAAAATVMAMESIETGVQETHEADKNNTDSQSSTKIDNQTTMMSKATKTLEIIEKVEEQQKEATRRSLRTRGDKQKKMMTMMMTNELPKPVPSAHDKSDKKSEDAATSAEVPSIVDASSNVKSVENSEKIANDSLPSDVIIKLEPEDPPQEQIYRTRRGREIKPLPHLSITTIPSIATKSKRVTKKQDTNKKNDSQQIKEDSILDNEVATINENNRRSPTCHQPNENVRGVSANADCVDQKLADSNNRSKSENDLSTSSSAITSNAIPQVIASCTTTCVKNIEECATVIDLSNGAEKIQETPEDRAKKEAVLRQLGLESWERVKEREAKKGEGIKSESPKHHHAGSLKTVIRIQKEKEKEKEKESKKRPRSPIKMIFNKQGRVDGEESSEFYKYTIQKEAEPGVIGESSSGANRKLPTNPRLSSDNNEDGEEAPLKDRQSLVIPEKSSSFSIHPERLCSDNCCYCYGKFGCLDTPMHLAQMKSEDRKNKILAIETHITPNSCLCDACYRHIDRKANASPTALLMKPPRRNTHYHETKCIVHDCNEPFKSHVKRRWLTKIKSHLIEKKYSLLDKTKEKKEDGEKRNEDEDFKWKINIDWKAAQQNLVPFCESHYDEISRFLKCVVCQRRLSRNNYFSLQLIDAATAKLHERFWEIGIPTIVSPGKFFCKLCKFFAKLCLQPKDSLSDSNRLFFESYVNRLGRRYEVGYVSEEDDETESTLNHSDKKNKDNRLSITAVDKKFKPMRKRSKSPNDRNESMSTSASDKSTPEPPHHDINEPEVTIREEGTVMMSAGVNTEPRCMSIEGAIEKLKKRKNLETLIPTRLHKDPSDVVEMLTRDKEVTLTVLPKKPRLDVPSNDISPVVQRLGNNPSISVRTLFPGEEEMNLQAGVEFNNVREVTPQGWEKCMTVVQYDKDTKLLWQELQRPYGNMSSFLRHLVLLEKYYRSGDLILAPNASRNAINYSTSVQNRLISYEGPEKIDEPMSLDVPTTIELNNSRRLSGGYLLENRFYNSSQSSPSSFTTSLLNIPAQLSKLENTTKVVKLTPMVSITKKASPNVQRVNTSGSSGGVNGSAKRKESIPIQKVHSGGSSLSLSGKVIQLSEPDYKRYQNLKKQKQIMNVKQVKSNTTTGASGNQSQLSYNKSNPGYAQKSQQQLSQHQQFQRHLRMQQEMYAQRSRSDFEPLVCDRLANENTPTQNYIHMLNLPKSIQVTTKMTNTSGSTPPQAASTPIPILPKIPKSLTVIPQTVSRIPQGYNK